MGLFGTDYNKEGKGISKNIQQKRRMFLFMEEYGRKFFALMKANVLYFIAILPALLGFILTGSEYKIAGVILLVAGLFTFGPATSAFTYILRNYVMQSHVWMLSDFKDKFKENYKQSLFLGMADILLPAVFVTAFNYYIKLGSIFAVIGGGIVLFAGVIFLMMNFYAYPMLITFDLKMGYILKNSLLFAIVKFPVNLFVLLVDGAIVYYFAMQIMSFNLAGFIIAVLGLLLFALSLVGFITVFTVWKYIEDAMIDEDDDSEKVFKDSVK